MRPAWTGVVYAALLAAMVLAIAWPTLRAAAARVRAVIHHNRCCGGHLARSHKTTGGNQ